MGPHVIRTPARRRGHSTTGLVRLLPSSATVAAEGRRRILRRQNPPSDPLGRPIVWGRSPPRSLVGYDRDLIVGTEECCHRGLHPRRNRDTRAAPPKPASHGILPAHSGIPATSIAELRCLFVRRAPRLWHGIPPECQGIECAPGWVYSGATWTLVPATAGAGGAADIDG